MEPAIEVELVDYVNHQRQQGGGPFASNPARGYQNHPAYSWDANRRPYDQQPQEQNQRYSAQSSQPQHQPQSQSANLYSQPPNNYQQPTQRYSQPAPPYVPPQQRREDKKPSMEELMTQFM
ncbi:hypothetical protein M5689_006575 [Euphorbia peplus]|nr:hypothetical protein M5689_006575 [Euphorbia peplus]